MLRDDEKPAPTPPCSACGEPSVFGFWEGALCVACHSAWSAAPHDSEVAEFAHAAAHPEDVEASGVAPSGRRWVSLRKEPHVELHRSIARAWVLARRQFLAKGAAA